MFRRSHFLSLSHRVPKSTVSADIIRMMNGSVHVLSKFVRSVCGRCAVGVRLVCGRCVVGEVRTDEHKRLSTV